MAEQNYSSSITANIRPHEAVERISRVADWWSEKFSGTADKVGDTFKLDWGNTVVDFTVAEVIPSKRIVWQVTDCNLHFVEHRKEWKDTQVIFDISSNSPTTTTVAMTHAGLTPETECYDTCKTGWDFYIMQSLQNLLRQNRGFPDMRGKQKPAEVAPAHS